MSADTIDLPVVVGGRVLTLSDLPDAHTLDYESGITVRIPAIQEHHLREVLAARGQLGAKLAKLTVHDVTTFFAAVGERWLDPAYPIRREAEDQASRITGFARRMIAMDYNFLGYVLRQRPYVYDYLEWELGHERAMDEWFRTKASWVRAFPQGVVHHTMVGNMTLANTFSLMWGAMTKNINVAKLAARDPVSPLALARAFVDVDPTHPMSQAMTVVYWGRDSQLADLACESANVVMAWGGAKAVKRIKDKTPAGVPVVEFGPKWSLAVVDLDRCDPEVAAWRMAADGTFYDQEACLSPQRLFIKGDVDAFIPRLCHYLDKAALHIPKESQNRDALAHFAMNRLEAKFRGWDMHTGDAWTVIRVDDPGDVVEHPLGRTVFVHPVTDIAEVARYLNHNSQTLCCEPWELGIEHRDAWALAGIDRVVELGMSRRPQYGYAHDGMRPLSRLVRWVTLEGGVHDFYRYNDYTTESVEDRLFPWRDPSHQNRTGA